MPLERDLLNQTNATFDNLFINDILTVNLFIFRFINRNEDEVKDILQKANIGQRKTSQHVSKLDNLRIKKETEEEEFTTSGLGNITIILI